MGDLTGVSVFIEGYRRRELVQVGAGVGDVGDHCEREFCGEGLTDSGNGCGCGKCDQCGRQDGGYCELHRDGNWGESGGDGGDGLVSV